MAAAKQRSGIDRDTALKGRPHRVPPVGAEERDGGGLLVTVELQRKGWQRWLGFPKLIRRSYGLDAVGRQVYDACDGRTTVRRIVRRFAEANRLNIAEAELAVTTFLKTLIGRGIIVMEVDRERPNRPARGGSSGGGKRSRKRKR